MIRPLRIEDADSFAALRRAALLDAPLSFGSSPEDDRFADTAAILDYLNQAPKSMIFGAFEDELIGVIGLYQDHHSKSSHKAHIWGMYLTPSARGKGIAAQLLQAATKHAETAMKITHLHLSVTSASTAAQRLYESAGFLPWGTEPDTMRHGGEIVSETYMMLCLDSGKA